MPKEEETNTTIRDTIRITISLTSTTTIFTSSTISRTNKLITNPE